MAGGLVAGTDLLQGGFGLGTDVLDIGTAGVKTTSGRGVDRAGDIAFE
jgi:hypothetical protein